MSIINKQGLNRFWKKTVITLLPFAFALQSYAADFSATVDRKKVGINEQLRLILKINETTMNSPDIGSLNQNFNVLGTSRSSQITIRNGKSVHLSSWVITLSPKKLGKVTIPGVKMGDGITQPITIEVVKNDTVVSTQQRKISVTANIDKGTYYTFQEIPLTVRVETIMPLLQAELMAPYIKDVEITQVGTNKSTQQSTNGQNFAVIERQYLLRPQKSGQITVPPFILQGRLRIESRNRLSGFNEAFGRGRSEHFVVKSSPLTLAIENNPSSQSEQWFLPAKLVELQSELQPQNPIFKVGEAVTRKVRLLALGASPEQLPKLSFDDIEGLKIYVDSDNTGMQESPQGTQALREVSVSIVPTKAGDYTLPKLSVKWFNTQTQKQEIAVLPAKKISVKNSNETTLIAQKSQPTTHDKTKSRNDGQAAKNNNVKKIAEKSTPLAAKDWLVIAAITAAVIMLITMLFVIWRKRQRPHHSDTFDKNLSENQIDYLANIEQAISEQNKKLSYHSLLQWQSSGVTFSEILQQHFVELGKHCYSYSAVDEAIDWNGIKIAAREQSRNQNSKVARKNKQLPPLYE